MGFVTSGLMHSEVMKGLGMFFLECHQVEEFVGKKGP